ncbi:hypothetical protein [Amycolatopsis sp. NPDC051102]|uniref:hypothetical protein n=1 Tax=Amycolatopsis sp. NPDC051102 TaxID=3155163 RepID=UPI0034297983
MTQPEQNEPESVVNSVSFDENMTGSIFQAGQIVGNVYHSSSGIARSWYLETVREVAPSSLANRTTELAELAKFCTAPDPSPQYVWWRAEAWSGKTALISWFVLNPPSNVRLVPFFITARYAGSDTRDDFLNVVNPQLAAILGIDAPKGDGPSEFRGLLSEAAKLCTGRGEHLVLVVDGLDEDRGTGQAGGARSIAALLPRNPVDGLRIIVTGRPNPGIPSVLPDDHPLHDPKIVRELAPSPAAEAARHAMEADLDRLLTPTAAPGRDVLGLLVAARGGLSRQDLVELTGEEAQIQKIMDSVQGRAFSRRRAHWHPRSAPEVYLLGHEGLQAEATRRLGEPAIRAYRRKITEWAEGYWERGWPAHTPQFLLQGYPRLLQEDGDFGRMVRCVTDLARQRRLAEVAGGEAAVQAEVAGAHAAVFASAKPDVLDIVRLTMHRDDLSDRNARTPTRLPALWARLGDFARAEALTRSISEPFRRADAVSALVEVLVEHRKIDRADRLIAETVDETKNPHVRRRFVQAVVAAGDLARARAIASAVADPDQRKRALLVVAAAEPETGPDKLLAAVEMIEGDETEAGARHFVASWLVRRGEIDGAMRMAEDLSALYREDVAEQAVEFLLRADDFESARRLADSTGNAAARWPVLRAEIELLARQDFDGARARVYAIEDIGSRERLMRVLTILATEMGDFDLAESLLDTMTSFEGKMALFGVLAAMGKRGLGERAGNLLKWAVAKPERRFDQTMRADAYTALAEGMLSSGDTEGACVFAHHAESAARHVGDSYETGALFRRFVEFAVTAGDVKTAERLARIIVEAGMKRQDFAGIARFLAERGDPRLAESLAFRVERISVLMEVLSPLLRRLRAGGETSAVRRIVARVDDLIDHFEGTRFDSIRLLDVAGFYCAAGLPRQALAWVAKFEDSFDRMRALSVVLKEFCAIGDIESAIDVVLDEGRDEPSGLRLAGSLAEALGEAGHREGLQVLKHLGVDPRSTAPRVFLEHLAEHDGERSFELAKTLLINYERTAALVAIAGKVGEPMRSRVLAEAMLDNDWSQALSALSADERLGLVAVIDQFIELQEARLGFHTSGE